MSANIWSSWSRISPSPSPLRLKYAWFERFITVVQTDEDYYYITYNGKDISWNTCVGSLIQLKNKINDKDYQRLIQSAKLNHNDQFPISGNIYREELIEEFTKDSEVILLTDICWDLN